MIASDKRQIADLCLIEAISGNYKSASLIRQKSYLLSPPGTMGIDWANESEVWGMDKKSLDIILKYDCADLKNTKTYIEGFKAAFFVDSVLFQFKDWYSISRYMEMSSEKLQCPDMDKYLKKVGFDFESQIHEFIYADTMKRNINYIMLSEKNSFLKNNPFYAPMPKGQYYIGFPPGTSEKVIDGRRKWLETYNLFEDMKKAGVFPFPKTFSTFEKHNLKNDEKFKSWEKQYHEIIGK